MNNGSFIRRNTGETIAQAARRISTPQVMLGLSDANFAGAYYNHERDVKSSSFVQELTEDSEDVESGADTEEEDLAPGEVYLSIPKCCWSAKTYGADRTVPSMRAKRLAFDGVHIPRRETAKDVDKALDKQVVQKSEKMSAGKIRDILSDVQPIDAHTPRFTEDIEMKEVPIEKNPCKENKSPARSTGVDNSGLRQDKKPGENKSGEGDTKLTGRQSEVQTSVNLPSIVDRILNLELLMTVREALAASKEICNGLQEVVRLRNVKAVMLGTDSPFVAHWAWPRQDGVLIRIELEINGRQVVAIVDTGSQLNVVRADVAALVLHRPVGMTQVTGMNDANGGRGELRGFIHDVELSCGGVMTKTGLWVSQQAPFELLLGRPWKRNNLVSIDEQEEGTYLVFTDHKTRLPRFELMAVPHDASTEVLAYELESKSFTYITDSTFNPVNHHPNLFDSESAAVSASHDKAFDPPLHACDLAKEMLTTCTHEGEIIPAPEIPIRKHYESQRRRVNLRGHQNPHPIRRSYTLDPDEDLEINDGNPSENFSILNDRSAEAGRTYEERYDSMKIESILALCPTTHGPRAGTAAVKSSPVRRSQPEKHADIQIRSAARSNSRYFDVLRSAKHEIEDDTRAVAPNGLATQNRSLDGIVRGLLESERPDTHLRGRNTRSNDNTSRDRYTLHPTCCWEISNEYPSQNFRDTEFQGQMTQQKFGKRCDPIEGEDAATPPLLMRRSPLEIPVRKSERPADSETEITRDREKALISPKSVRTEIRAEHQRTETRQSAASLTCTRTLVRQCAPAFATKERSFPAGVVLIGEMEKFLRTSKVESTLDAQICGGSRALSKKPKCESILKGDDDAPNRYNAGKGSMPGAPCSKVKQILDEIVALFCVWVCVWRLLGGCVLVWLTDRLRDKLEERKDKRELNLEDVPSPPSNTSNLFSTTARTSNTSILSAPDMPPLYHKLPPNVLYSSNNSRQIHQRQQRRLAEGRALADRVIARIKAQSSPFEAADGPGHGRIQDMLGNSMKEQVDAAARGRGLRIRPASVTTNQAAYLGVYYSPSKEEIHRMAFLNAEQQIYSPVTRSFGRQVGQLFGQFYTQGTGPRGPWETTTVPSVNPRDVERRIQGATFNRSVELVSCFWPTTRKYALTGAKPYGTPPAGAPSETRLIVDTSANAAIGFPGYAPHAA
ncbi:hypothetical protein C8R45DRAFT_1114934 [Mycena sanguinolenta]|nr:hypothetical protein C8R45DRAFT_1114934 [Mycena sanguinolenta]